ncbi:helix-turn-helix domain-containing protein [Clostridium beijerinckii]|uniref:helix-turn-helix domain-containing protein n=1 Tax=Clostridium beijerinckii TaxID=1520 RepID=UPI00233008DC|nr:helix-turn-helix transcriptional regulator [Clostridium beijerinckii]
MPINIKAVKKIMINNGMTPDDLAKTMKVSKSRVSKLLNDSNSNSQFKTIYSLAKALKVKPAEIIKEEVE